MKGLSKKNPQKTHSHRHQYVDYQRGRRWGEMEEGKGGNKEWSKERGWWTHSTRYSWCIWNCTLETSIFLLTGVTPINSIKKSCLHRFPLESAYLKSFNSVNISTWGPSVIPVVILLPLLTTYCFFATLSSFLASSLFQQSIFVKSHADLSLGDQGGNTTTHFAVRAWTE